MATLENYFHETELGYLGGGLDWSPFRHDDVLQECMVVDVRCNVIDSIVGIIVDRRTGLDEIGGDTGLMVLEGVSRLDWTGSATVGRPYSRSIMSHRMTVDGDRLAVRFHVQKAVLDVDFRRGYYYEGDVIDLDQAQPDLTEWRSPYPKNGFQEWGSEFRIVGSDAIAVA